MENEIEIWKDIQEFEGVYQVSSLGRIKRVKRFSIDRCLPEKIMKSRIYGLFHVIDLIKNGKKKSLVVHFIVAQNFVPNPNNFSRILYKNKNINDLRASNLGWCSHSDLYKFSVEAGFRKSLVNNKSNAKICESQVKEIYESFYNSTLTVEQIALDFGLKPSIVYSIINKKAWKEITNKFIVGKKPITKIQTVINPDFLESEVWLPAKNLEEKYTVSSFGRVRNIKTGRILNGRNNGSGYLSFLIKKDEGGQHSVYFHRLVLETFTPVPNPKTLEAHHKNYNRSDNRLENLEWLSSGDNSRDSFKNNRFKERDSRFSQDRIGKTRTVLTHDQREHAYKLYLSGLSQREVGKIIGISIHTVRSIVNKFKKGFYELRS